MASKKRGGLSKRELAVKAKKKASLSVAPKVSSRAVASKAPVATGPAIGPLMPGQIRSNSGPAIGPLLPNQTRATTVPSKSSSSSRDLASKAQQKKLNPASSVKAAEASGLLGTQSTVPAGDTIKAGGSGIFDRLKGKAAGVMGNVFSNVGDYNKTISEVRGRGNQGLADGMVAGSQSLFDSTLGTPRALASEEDGMSGLGRALQTASQPDIPTSYGDNGETFFNGNERMSPLASDFGTGSNFSRPGSETAYKQGRDSRPSNPFGIPTAQDSELNYTPDNYKQNSSQEKNYTSQYDIPEDPYQPTQEEITQQNNEDFGGGIGPVDNGGATIGNRSGRGSGAFGTGKGVMSDDPYIKELRKAYSSNGGEKWLRKQFEELISALDPTYAQMQKEGEDSLNAKLLNDNTQLASVMNAGNVGDSEQRAQLMAQQQQGSQTALGNLLAKLSQSKAQDVSGYKSQQAEAMSKLQQGKQQDARTLLEKIQAYRGQQGQGQTSGRVAGPAKTPKLSRTEVFNWVEDALGKGYSWQEIADNAQEQGIGTETGGYLDQLLNNANKQNRYR